jgi:hypothetical protein
MNYHAIPPGKDPQLWQLANKRAAFKRHLVAYLIINIMLWTLWLFSGAQMHGLIPWPLWSTFGWGIGLAFHFAGAYITHYDQSVEREYNKLTEQKNQQQQ